MAAVCSKRYLSERMNDVPGAGVTFSLGQYFTAPRQANVNTCPIPVYPLAVVKYIIHDVPDNS